jgi:sugar phosphate isomerase/epimerase
MDWASLREDVPLGSGDVDFDYFFAFLKTTGFDGSLAVESGYGPGTDYDDMIDDLNRTYGFIVNHLC